MVIRLMFFLMWAINIWFFMFKTVPVSLELASLYRERGERGEANKVIAGTVMMGVLCAFGILVTVFVLRYTGSVVN